MPIMKVDHPMNHTTPSRVTSRHATSRHATCHMNVIQHSEQYCSLFLLRKKHSTSRRVKSQRGAALRFPCRLPLTSVFCKDCYFSFRNCIFGNSFMLWYCCINAQLCLSNLSTIKFVRGGRQGKRRAAPRCDLT